MKSLLGKSSSNETQRYGHPCFLKYSSLGIHFAQVVRINIVTVHLLLHITYKESFHKESTYLLINIFQIPKFNRFYFAVRNVNGLLRKIYESQRLFFVGIKGILESPTSTDSATAVL